MTGNAGGGRARMKQGRNGKSSVMSGRASLGSMSHGMTHSSLTGALFDLAQTQARDGKLAEAVVSYRRLIAKDPMHWQAHAQLARALQHQGQPAEAVAVLRRALEQQPGNADLLLNLGLTLRRQERHAEAEAALREAIALRPAFAAAHLELSNALAAQHRPAEALASIHAAIAAQPASAAAHYNLGNLHREAGRLEEAVAAYRAAIRHQPDYVEAHYNLGIALRALGRYEEAVAANRQAIRLRPNHAAAFNNAGLALKSLGRDREADKAFRKAIEIKPDFPQPYHNLAGLMLSFDKVEEAIRLFRKSLALKPDSAAVAIDLALALKRKQKPDEAEKILRQVLGQPKTGAAERRRALEHLAGILKDENSLVAAQECYNQILQQDPEHAEALAGLCHAKASMCDWRDRDAEFARLMVVTERQIAAGERTALTSFSALARPLSATQHLAIGRSWAEDTKRQMARRKGDLEFRCEPARRHDRLRIGYVSQDFRNQAMGHLTRTMYGLHDRSEFEIFGYSVRKSDNSIYRKTIEAGCEHFADIHAISAVDGAKRIHADEVDILIDLMGFTEGNRLGVVALRPAPVTVGFLRFPGSSGADFIDYMLTDRVVTTPADEPYYSEKLVYLPHCYQPNDGTQEIDEGPVTRAEFDLPDDAVVFSCFNNHYKFEPFIYDLWMRIMHQVPNSVLWVLAINPEMGVNLKREAEACGISADRIICAKKIAKARHLARQKLADLFLDTRYYTSHTTGSDALWGGLPALTCPSDTFASRVTASLLNAARLPELIVPTFEEYERLAIHLATHLEELKAIRDKWAAQRTTCPLFDTPRFVRNLERAYRLIWANYVAGNPPRPIEVVEN